MFDQFRRDSLKLILFLVFATLQGCKTPTPQKLDLDKSQNQASEIQIPEPKLLETHNLITKIQFGSCAHQKYPQPLWKTMLAEKPDLYIGTGDNVYASSNSDKPIAQAYRLQSLQPEFAIYRSQVPMVATWDDHDYGMNDGGADNPEKEDAKLEFFKFWPNDAQAIDPRQGGIYHSFLIGPEKKKIQIILLDTRYFRDALVKSKNPPYPPGVYVANENKETTILGSIQWQWLEEELKKPSAFRIVVSSIQVLPQENGFEKWDNFPHERDRLIALLSKKKNTIIISGDRHAGEISKTKSLFEITASGINRNSTIQNEKNKFRIGDRILDSNFGQIEVDWKKKSLNVFLIDLNGKRLSRLKFRF